MYLIEKFDKVLCLNLISADESTEQNLDREIEELIAKRQEARANKDWATADAIRDELAARHIKLIDTPEGIKWEIQE